MREPKTSHWSTYHRSWAKLTAPLRPNGEIVNAFKASIGRSSGRVLLLGVTPELADVAAPLVAVDRHETMIAHVWPGDSKTRRVVKGDWLNMSFAEGYFSAAIGDGSLIALHYPLGYQRLYEQLARIVQPAGRFVVRAFLTPDPCESFDAVRDETMNGGIRSFHAFKWRLAMALVAETGDPNIEVVKIRDAFDRKFPARADIAKATGWDPKDIDTIDVYEGSSEVYSFPTFAQFCSVIPDTFTNVHQVPSGTYELAERCPLVVMDLKS